MGLQFGNNLGDALGAEMQAYLDKVLLTNLVENMIFDRFATITKALPQHSSKQIEFRKWIRMSDLYFTSNINKTFTGNTIDLTTNKDEESYIMVGKNEYSNFVLPEGSSGTSKGDMKRIKVSANVFPIGNWIPYTEEIATFDDMWDLRETAVQMGEMAGLISDAFYRDLYYNGASHRHDITGGGAGNDNVKDQAFSDELKKIYIELKLSGAKPVSKLLTASANYGTVPVQTSYVLHCHTIAAQGMRENPDFVSVEKYASGTKVLDNEIGKIGMFRIVENEHCYIESLGGGEFKAEILILGNDTTAQVPLRGKKRIDFIYKGLGSAGTNDQLNRVGSIGYKSWYGAKVLYPERLGVIDAKTTWS